MGRWIRKGQTLRTNLHYHPNGTPQIDRTRIGLYFGKGELKKEVAAALAGNLPFTIPPNAPNHELRAVYVADQDINVVSFFPHMHLRGRDMTMTATFPGGRQETLLSVPAYDFNWQLFYYPKNACRCRKARGSIWSRTTTTRARTGTTRIRPRPVRFGEASTAEMMFGMFEFTAADGVSPKPSTERTRMTALLSSFPTDSAFLIEVPFGKEPSLAVFHLPRSGDGSLYWTTVGPADRTGAGPAAQMGRRRVRVPDRAGRRTRRRLLHRDRHRRRRRLRQGDDEAARTDAAAVIRVHRRSAGADSTDDPAFHRHSGS